MDLSLTLDLDRNTSTERMTARFLTNLSNPPDLGYFDLEYRPFYRRERQRLGKSPVTNVFDLCTVVSITHGRL